MFTSYHADIIVQWFGTAVIHIWFSEPSLLNKIHINVLAPHSLAFHSLSIWFRWAGNPPNNWAALCLWQDLPKCTCCSLVSKAAFHQKFAKLCKSSPHILWRIYPVNQTRQRTTIFFFMETERIFFSSLFNYIGILKNRSDNDDQISAFTVNKHQWSG